jgi:hypothetical protein
MIAFGGSGVVIASQAGHMLPPLPQSRTRRWLATLPGSSTSCPSSSLTSSLAQAPHAISISTRGNTLRVQAASVEWGDRGTRVTPSAGHHS